MKNPLDDFCEKVEELLGKTGAGARGEFPGPEFRRNFRALASGLLARMNLVSREEFDAQSAALSRAVERMEALEKRLGELRPGSGSEGSGGDFPKKNPPCE